MFVLFGVLALLVVVCGFVGCCDSIYTGTVQCCTCLF